MTVLNRLLLHAATQRGTSSDVSDDFMADDGISTQRSSVYMKGV